MVMMTSTRRGRFLKFHNHALKPNVLFVRSFESREAISHPYRIRLDLVSKRRDLDSDALLRTPAFLGLKQVVPIAGSQKLGVRTHKLHGVAASFEELGYTGEWTAYRVLLVPRLWRLSLNVTSRVFQRLSVPEIVQKILEDPKGLAFKSKQDFDFVLDGKRNYRKREYVVQYQESDLHFISRLLEHEGIFYFFDQGDEAEKVIFADGIKALKPVPVTPRVPYLPAEQSGMKDLGAWFQEERIRKWSYRHAMGSAEVVLKDYHDGTPSVNLKVSEPAAGTGFGALYEHADHYRDKDEGKELARIRAEELKAREKLFSGMGDARAFRAGATFTLERHPKSDFNLEYLLTTVNHAAKQDLGAEGYGTGLLSYANEFTCILADVQFRPERVTLKPRISGALHAKVDAAREDELYAEIDERGRYKVALDFDLSGKGGGTASHFVRMAQPYAGRPIGQDYGMHFPLHKGTEVLLTHENGDPDRPVIAAAVPNPESQSPVTGGNDSQSIVRTGGENELICEDLLDSRYVWIKSPEHTSYLNLGAGHDPVPSGVTICTQKGISAHAGEGISIAAGASCHAEGVEKAQSLIRNILGGAGVVAAIAGVCATSKGNWAQLLGGATDLIGDLASWGVGNISSSTCITAPGTVTAAAGGGAYLAALGGATVLGIGGASLLSPVSAMVAGLLSTAVIAGGRAELISAFSDVKIRAKAEVRIDAQKKDVIVDANAKDVQIGAEQNLTLKTRQGGGTVSVEKKLDVESRQAKVIELRAGKSTLVLTDEGISLKADKIYLETSDKLTTMEMANQSGGFVPFLLDSTGRVWIKGDEGLHCHTKGWLDLYGDQKIDMSTNLLSQTKVKKIQRGESEERSPSQAVSPGRNLQKPAPPRGDATAADAPKAKADAGTDTVPARGR